MSYSNSLNFSDSTFIILRDLIHERTGLYYEDNKQSLLANKLTVRVLERGLSSFLDYYYLLKYDVESNKEWQELMNCLSVQETFFWREFDQIQALVEILLPQYIKIKTQKSVFCDFEPLIYPIRIWSAACSTGEEPLSIAIALNEAGLFNKFPIEIYASDASPSAIHKARLGIYRDYSFRSLPAYLKSKYFEQISEQTWKISPFIHQRIHWQLANLTLPEEIQYLSTSPFIFCRNVFIYFSDTSICKTVQHLFEMMPRPSYLFISAAESLLKFKLGFELQEVDKAFVYVKPTQTD